MKPSGCCSLSAPGLVEGLRDGRDELGLADRLEQDLDRSRPQPPGAKFTDALRDSTILPGGPETGLPLLVPLLILAAVRFGAGGASLSILTLALIAIGDRALGAERQG